jgi:hypothetical protein
MVPNSGRRLSRSVRKSRGLSRPPCAMIEVKVTLVEEGRHGEATEVR